MNLIGPPMKSLKLASLVAAYLALSPALTAQSPSPGATEKPHLYSVDTSRVARDAAARGKEGGSVQKDLTFMKQAAQGSLMEVEMGRMAQKRAKSNEVRRLGGKIAADHTIANKELTTIASKKGVDLSKEKPPKMESLSKSDFDKEYLAVMVKDHEKDISEFETAAKDSLDPDLKRYAEKTLPTLRKHLELVKKAQEQLK